jgi:hypothetical protein
MSGRINWLAVVLAAIVQIAIGFAWYGYLFQAPWMAAVGIPPEAAAAADGAAMAAPMIVSVLSAFAIAILLSLIVSHSNDWGVLGGLGWGFLLWLLLALPMHAIPNVWAGRDWMLTIIDGGEALAALLAAGFIIGIWPPTGARKAD